MLVGEGEDFVGILDGLGGAGYRRGLRAGSDVAGGDLVAEVANGLRGRPDPDQSGVDDGLGELGVLGEEAVARVDGVGAGLLRGVENLVDDQVGLGRRLTAEGESFVGEANERCIGVRFCVNRDTGEAGVRCRSNHPNCNLAAVRDENLGDTRTGMAGH